MEEKLTLKKFEEASEIVKKVTLNTNLIYSDYFSDQTGNQVYIKPENMQFTGAYKVRGSYYKISTLSDEERERGLITASAGNHAQGVAYAAKIFGVKATVVMPTVTPLMKVNRTKSYGADVILYGDVYDDACNYALNLAQKEGYTFIHPFDDLDVATGQGTIAMEIFKELPTVDYILVPIGGGGLATGVSTLAKMLNPRIKVIGVEPENAACMKASLKAGEVITLPSANTIADGTAVKTPGTKIFPYIKENIDDIITIKDEELIDAFLDMVENHKLVAENSGLLTIAALKHLKCTDKKIVSIISGGNMDMNLRKDANFVQDENWYRQSRKYEDFLSRSKGKNVVLLEIGVGFNTPGIIRLPFEQMTANSEKTTLIRINKDYPNPMLEIRNKTISFDEDTNKIIEDLKE